MQWQAVFIDRDGTLGGGDERFIHPDDFELYPRAQEAIHRLRQAGTRVFAFTNQYRIARGMATLAEFERKFREYGFDGSYICPHDVTDGCGCRKPETGMLVRAAQEHGLDLTRCAVVGDGGESDMLAAHRVGAAKVLVRTGWGELSLGERRPMWSEAEPDYVAHNLYDAAQWLLERVHSS